MACGDPKAAFRAAILDPALTISQPRAVTATAGYDAISHAVETWVTTKSNFLSDLFAREAFRLLDGHYERVLADPEDLDGRGAMLLGAHYAGIAIEASMLGATHACANPLTARYGTAHGVAIGLMLTHVVRWNARAVDGRYAELLAAAGRTIGRDSAATLADRLEELAAAGGLPRRLRAAGVREADLPALAEDAAQQWTGRFNPRPLDAAGALELYQGAF
jgi:alcohol dehydrogenase